MFKNRILTEKSPRVTVKGSPFNGLKVDILLILLLGIIFASVSGYIFANKWVQLLALLGYGGGSSLWIIGRIKKVYREKIQK